MTNTKALKRAWKVCGGSQASLARKLGVTPGLVSHWYNGRVTLLPEWALRIERATEGAVRRDELLPELFAPTVSYGNERTQA